MDDQDGRARPHGAAAGVLRVHVAERADALVESLAGVLAVPPADPFALDLVAVPTRGVERWVAQRLSHRLGARRGAAAHGDARGDARGEARGEPLHAPDGPDATGPDEDGVCAGVRFASPGRIVADVLAAVAGVRAQDDPWRPERLAWEVLDVLDEHADEPWLAGVAHHVGLRASSGSPDARDEHRRGRRLHLAQRIAGLLTAYDEHRPALARAWTAGRDPGLGLGSSPGSSPGSEPSSGPGLDTDGAGTVLAPDLAWQPRVWRALVERLGPPPAARVDDAVARLVADPGLVDLPERLSVFGPTALPAAHLEVLRALAVGREVHLWLPQPSLALWRSVAPVGTGTRRRDLARPAHHPLLRSMALDATELAARVRALGPVVEEVAAPPPAPTILGALQARLRADRPADGPDRAAQGAPGRVPPDDRLVPAADDRTVQVHACHGRSRQVEVLRDVVVGLLADDDTLEPRDIVVMCPDVEAFAPLVHAAFSPIPHEQGADAPAPPREHPGRALRVRIADRAPARANPVLATLETILELAGSRVTASAVVDLAGQDPVRERFAFDDDALDRVRTWALESGVHWGEDVARRARFQLGAVAQGTWSAALDRLLLGAAMAEEDQRFVGSVLPVDDVGSSDLALVGRFAELLDRLASVLADLEGAHDPAHWFGTLERALDLLTATAPAERWQSLEAVRVLARARAGAAGHDAPLRLPDVVAALRPVLDARPTRAGFRTGALTVCSLAPMRAVPHRVVVLAGMDDGAFPRAARRDGDDVLARDPLVGERDRRQEDRQLFLDAVTSATDHLVVLHTGADERTGAPRPPCVPVGELLDALDDAVALPGGAREALVVEHPLQPVDPRVFTPGALGRPGPFGFDAMDLAAAHAAVGPRVATGPLVARPLPPREQDEPDCALEDLVDALAHAPRAFVVQRLGARLPADAATLEDRIPLELDPLARARVGRRVLEAALDGAPIAAVAAAERRRGHLPPRQLGGSALGPVVDQVVSILETTRGFLTGAPGSRDVRVDLGGRALTGTVRGVHGDRLVGAEFSELGPRQLLGSWVRLLALVADGARVRTAVTVGRGKGGAALSVLRAPEPEHAREILTGLLTVRDEAMCEPIPLLARTSHAYATARWQRESPHQALRAARWELGRLDDAENGRGALERIDPYHVLAWGSGFDLDDLLGTPGAVDRTARPGEPTRFGAVASRVWRDLLEHERFEEAP